MYEPHWRGLYRFPFSLFARIKATARQGCLGPRVVPLAETTGRGLLETTANVRNVATMPGVESVSQIRRHIGPMPTARFAAEPRAQIVGAAQIAASGM